MYWRENELVKQKRLVERCKVLAQESKFLIATIVEQFGKIVVKVRPAEPNLMQVCEARASLGQKSLIQSPQRKWH